VQHLKARDRGSLGSWVEADSPKSQFRVIVDGLLLSASGVPCGASTWRSPAASRCRKSSTFDPPWAGGYRGADGVNGADGRCPAGEPDRPAARDSEVVPKLLRPEHRGTSGSFGGRRRGVDHPAPGRRIRRGGGGRASIAAVSVRTWMRSVNARPGPHPIASRFARDSPGRPTAPSAAGRGSCAPLHAATLSLSAPREGPGRQDDLKRTCQRS